MAGGKAGMGMKCWRLAGLSVAACMLGVPLGVMAAPTAPVAAGVVDPARVSALALRIRALLERTGSSSVGAISARLSAEVGASGANCGTVKAALAQVDRKGLSAAATVALDGVAGSADLCAGLGTGGIAQGQALAQPTTLGLPGGSSNYQ